MHVCMYVCMYVYVYVYIYIYMVTPLNYQPSFCVVNAVFNLLSRQVRIPYLSKIANTKPPFQVNAPLNSFRFEVSTHSTATVYASTHKPTARQLAQDRRDHALNGNTVLFKRNTNFCPRDNNKKQHWELIWPDSRKIVFLVSLGKTFGKTSCCRAKCWFSLERQTLS